jgi:hypothetical protein
MGGGYEQEELIVLIFYLFLIVTESKMIVLSRDEGVGVVKTTWGLFGILILFDSAMGVFAPVVDYQVATQFRDKQMGWEPNMEMTSRMLTEFGYTEDDLPHGGNLIEV